MGAVIDITSLQSQNPTGDWYRRKGGRPLVRDPKTITGIVLHQTGIEYDVSKGQVAKAGGDRHRALHNRGLGVHAHMAVFSGKRAGVKCNHALVVNPLPWYVHHGDKLNSRSLGIEVEGNLPMEDTGVVDPALIKAAREGIKYLVREGRRQGMPIKYIWAHRQANPDRPRCPGGELWKKLVLEYAVPVLGLEIQPDLTVSGGRSIKESWGRTAVRVGLGVGSVWAVGAAGVLGYIGWQEYKKYRARRGRSSRRGA